MSTPLAIHSITLFYFYLSRSELWVLKASFHNSNFPFICSLEYPMMKMCQLTKPNKYTLCLEWQYKIKWSASLQVIQNWLTAQNLLNQVLGGCLSPYIVLWRQQRSPKTPPGATNPRGYFIKTFNEIATT
jgi:hypothetical protein